MSDTLSVPPAMTAEEWSAAYIGKDVDIYQKSRGLDGSRRLEVIVRGHPLGGSMGDQRDLHALAALCLYQQPFGFSREDVALLNHYAAWETTAANWCPDGYVFGTMDEINRQDRLAKANKLTELASRISSLLPPETP